MSRKRKKGKKKIQPRVMRPLPVGAESEGKKVDSSLKINPAPKKGSKKLKKIYLPLTLGLIIFLFLLWLERRLLPSLPREEGLNCLLITLDTTRADRLGCYGYELARTPNIDSLARSGVMFAQAYAQVPLTFPSHCSIFTGTYPIYHGARNNGTYYLPEEIKTLAQILKEQGYHTAAFVSSFTVDSRFGLDRGFDLYDDYFGRGQAFKATNAERRAEEVFQAFSRWLEGNNSQPFFCWVHFFDPHLPYDPPSPYLEEFMNRPYDGEIAYMDFYVGQVMRQLREKKLLARTVVILAGDHGEALGEKGEEGHGVFLYEESMRVPLIIYWENRFPSGKVITPRVRLIDLMPSVLDLLKIPIPAEIQGQSLLPYIERKKAADLPNYMETYFPRENYGWSELVGLMDKEWKYIRAPREELYNLKKDPEETNNLAAAEKKVVANLKKKLEDYIRQYSSRFLAQRKDLTPEEREKLRSLGYISFTDSPPSGPLPDPKDRLEELKKITQAEKLEFQEKWEEAVKVYEEILSLRPDSPTNYINLALTLARLGRFEEAVNVLERGRERLPQSIMLLSRLGHTYLVLGRLKKSLEVWQQVLQIDAHYFDALLSSGWILDLMGKKKEARYYYEQALAREPENKFLRHRLAFNLATSGSLKEAIELYEKLREEYPDDYEICQDLGIAYGYAGEIEKAIVRLEEAIQIKPTPTAYFNLAVAYKKAGKIAQAVKYLELYLSTAEGEDEEKIRSARAELSFLKRQLQK